jgi:cell shape-determining protein MreC
MNATEQQLKRIQDKVQQMLKNQSVLQKENARLREELDHTKQHTGTQQKDIEVLKQQVDVLKVGTGDMSAAEKKEFEKRINGYLKEIDRCITLLSE